MSYLSDSEIITDYPCVVLWEITCLCNHSCIGCGNVFRHNGHEINIDDFRTYLSLIKGSTLDIRLTGGEPTLHPNIREVLYALDDTGLPFSILTNGDWEKPSSFINLVSNLRHFNSLLISLHGNNKSKHDSFVCSSGSFDRVLANIRKATESGIYVSTNTILSRVTHDVIPQIADLAHRHGATYAVFNRYYGADPCYAISNDSLRIAVESVTRMRLKGKMVRLGNCTPLCFADCDSDGCPAGVFSITIDPWLNVRPCNHSPFKVGNLKKTDLNSIWNGPAMNKWRRMIPSQCEGCTYQTNCGSGCRAEAQLHGVRTDPLITSKVTSLNRTPLQVKLYKDQTFKSNFKLKKDSFGYILYCEGEVIGVNNSFIEVIKCIESGYSANRICDIFGSNVLRYLAELLLRGFIEFSEQPETRSTHE